MNEEKRKHIQNNGNKTKQENTYKAIEIRKKYETVNKTMEMKTKQQKLQKIRNHIQNNGNETNMETYSKQWK